MLLPQSLGSAINNPEQGERRVQRLMPGRRFGNPGNALPPAPRNSILLDSWRTICGHWKIVAGMALAGLLGGMLITLPQTPQYRAFTLLEVRNLNENFL